jgi:serine/threonine-protein kinase PknG
VLATLALVGSDQRQALLETIPRSPELSLNNARFAMDEGDFVAAKRELDSEEARESGWRAAWWRGVLQLAEGLPSDGLSYFAAVAAELPGELAPKLAMAACFELAADDDDTVQLRYASRYFGLVAMTDPGYASASFGSARVSMRLGDREEAITALEGIPKSSSAYVTAQMTLCRVQCAHLPGEVPQLTDLIAGSKVLEALTVENSVRLPLVRDLHREALSMLVDGSVQPDEGVQLMGAALDESSQRLALERAFRSLAKLAVDDLERYALVDQANSFRPRTLT